MAISIEDFDLLSNEVRALKALCLGLRDTIEGSIISNNLHADAIQTNNIKDDSIIASKIKALSIDASKIAVGTITSDQIEEGTIAADRLKVGDITAIQIASGSITAGLLKTGGQAFSHSMEFSSTDADTIAWTSGTIKTADGTIYSIDAGNTGNMTARTYIYLDKSVSETVLQTSTSYDAPLGDERIPIATAKNGTGNAIFQVFQGGGGVFISGGMIAAHTIGATQIASKTITSNEIYGTSLGALRATLGTVSAGAITASTISGTRYTVGTGTTSDIYFSGAGIRMYDGSNSLAILKIGGTGIQFSFSSGVAKIDTTSSTDLVLSNSGCDYKFWRGGTLQMPSLVSAPTGHEGDTAVEDSGSSDGDETFHFYVNAHWLSCSDTSGW